MKKWMIVVLAAASMAQAQTDAEIETDSTISRAEVRNVIKKNLGPIKECYQKELKNNSGLEGKLVIRFTVTDQGKVSQLTPKRISFESLPVEDCVMNVIGSLNFPPAPKGTVADISYPFVFGKETKSKKK